MLASQSKYSISKVQVAKGHDAPWSVNPNVMFFKGDIYEMNSFNCEMSDMVDCILCPLFSDKTKGIPAVRSNRV